VIQPEAYSVLIDDAEVLVAADVAADTLLGVGVCSPEIGLINACYVAPGMTRRGIGRTLTNAMEALLLDASAREARLNATLNAVAFYRSLGYRNEVPTLNRLPSGIDLPCVAMSKPLS
jgi:ribosomal protein S18 acetylase RimI-like enzyme